MLQIFLTDATNLSYYGGKALWLSHKHCNITKNFIIPTDREGGKIEDLVDRGAAKLR